MSKFKVGDLVICTRDDIYEYTNRNSVCEVVFEASDDRRMEVKYVFGEAGDMIGHLFTVDEQFFDYAYGETDNERKRMKLHFDEGDLITCRTDEHYGVTNSDSVCEVVRRLSEDVVRVKVVDHVVRRYVGQLFNVEEVFFVLADDGAEPINEDDLSLLFS